MKSIWNFILATVLIGCVSGDGGELYRFEGRVVAPPTISNQKEFYAQTTVLVDSKYIGFVRADGGFVVHIPSGQFIVDISNPTFGFEPTIVEVTSRGKIRVRKLNHLKPNEVRLVEYPPRFSVLGKLSYFQQREQFRVTDIIFSPTVLMMVVPLALILVLPKLVQDPATQKELQSMNSALLNPKANMPDLAEWLSGISSGSKPNAKSGSSSKSGAVRRR